ncbi:patatin-like phospholipase family protein [Cryptosporangium aurantiacum]|uniref:NTE family protein n=1 Tax=Cryptosporangium aurantiacum TaxID=134849 RepID=A0A1M7PPC2_9ACTN|nr:patatin-like phospholipase family protein [Cryptosporangium aurantiacum]SHN18996.1 NTE family protein [Cryptosporangium aurantiacum]
MKRALVLAGGGVAGIAWELGVLHGIQETDPKLADQLLAADLLLGTSAGATVAAQIAGGTSLAELYAAQLNEASAEIEVDLDLADLMARFIAATTAATSLTDLRQRVGTLALATETVEESVRRTAIAARLPVATWADRALLIPAIDAETGEMTVFTRDSGVGLVDAVAASCAVPGVWPPVTINGRRYYDGGIPSATNTDLATGQDRILILSPSLPGTPAPWGSLDEEINQLKPAQVQVVHADADSAAAFGPNPLSPTTRGPAARAGRVVGSANAERISRFWNAA